MKNCDKQNLIISIESSIDFIESHLDSADKSIAFILFNRLCGRYCYRCGLSYLPWSKQGV